MKLLLLDLDGTVREPIKGQWVSPPSNQRVIEGVLPLLEATYSDWAKIGITNQGGVGAGHKTMSDMILEQQLTLQLIPSLDFILACPDFEGKLLYKILREDKPSVQTFNREGFKNKWGDCIYQSFRKPGCGMHQFAIDGIESDAADEGINIEVGQILVVGDREEDFAASERLQEVYRNQPINIDFMWASDWLKMPIIV